MLLLHIPYHPLDILRREFKTILHKMCFTPNKNGNSLSYYKRRDKDGNLKIDRVTIAYHRQKNLRDMICPAKLRETKGINAQKIHDEIMQM